MLIKNIGLMQTQTGSSTIPIKCKGCGKLLHKQKHEVCNTCRRLAVAKKKVK
jgi:rRNA maturation endonuclease Nob1